MPVPLAKVPSPHGRQFTEPLTAQSDDFVGDASQADIERDRVKCIKYIDYDTQLTFYHIYLVMLIY